jgi:hypothetical protein
MDFFTVPTITFGLLYCFFIISHDWRRVLHVNVKQYEGDEGLLECIGRAASTPSMLRMTRSSGTKSGLSSWGFLTPVVPLSASPQTVHPELTDAERTRRVIMESSTTKIHPI